MPAETLRAIIRDKGPISVADYMGLCLGHPSLGYYNTHDPLGAAGDFTTAPEISQVFGELIGVWCAHMWQMMGAPNRFDLIELGPGRGTLMRDLIRAASKLPGFREAANVHFVEMSPALKDVQKRNMAAADITAQWHRTLGNIGMGPCVIVANEFFDALPVHQFIVTEQGWRERLVAAQGDTLLWCTAMDAPVPGMIPAAIENAALGSCFERAPIREAYLRDMAARLKDNAGAALIIDYGFAGPLAGDTFQAMRRHEFTDPLATPGLADLTSHVDFSALIQAAQHAGCAAYGPISQAALLEGLGVGLRLDALKRARPDRASDLDLACARLVSPDQMGALFKAIALSSVGIPPPFAAD